MTNHFPDATIMERIAQQAVDAAMSAGATYADVRLTHLLSERYESRLGGSDTHDELSKANDLSVGQAIDVGDFGGGNRYQSGLSERPSRIEGIPTITIGIGVRALVHGYWGFASCASWTDADAVRLGRDATAQAAVNARAGKPRTTELGTIPIVRKGRWVQPGIDPFLVPVDEKLDVLRALTAVPAQGYRFVQATVGSVAFQRDERVFASSEGASYSQVRYRCLVGDFVVNLGSDPERDERGRSWSSSEHLADARYARGWEVIRDLDMDQLGETLLSQVIAERQRLRSGHRPEIKPVDIGKYDVVFDTGPTASLVYQTLGVATELDRAMGYEANAGGTSYLGPDPFQYLGTQIVSSHVTLTADRTTPHANATAQWDDEGVLCHSFPLIQKGLLVDYQTTREQAHWIADWYTRKGIPIQSNGCAVAETALDYPMQMSPNFTLEPGPEAIDVDDLIKDTKRGVYFPAGILQVDQQVKNGVVRPSPGAPPPREIRDGKLGPILNGAGVLFNSRELWKNVLALGGANSADYSAAGESKGEPSQRSQCNVRTVPIKVKDCAIIDVERKA
jgi:TldD protein